MTRKDKQEVRKNFCFMGIMWKRYEASQMQALQQLMLNLQKHFELVNSLVQSACKSAYMSKPHSLLQQAQQADLEANTHKILQSEFFDNLRSNHRLQRNLEENQHAHEAIQQITHETARRAKITAIRAVHNALELVESSMNALLQRTHQTLDPHMGIMGIADLDTHEKNLQEKHDEKKKRKMLKKLMKMHAGQASMPHVTHDARHGFPGFPMHAIPHGSVPHGSVPHGTPGVVPMQGVPMWVPQQGLMHSPMLPGVQGMHANVAHRMYVPALPPHISPISHIPPIPQTMYML